MDKEQIVKAFEEIKPVEAKNILLDVVKQEDENTISVLFSKYFESQVVFVGVKSQTKKVQKPKPKPEPEFEPEGNVHVGTPINLQRPTITKPIVNEPEPHNEQPEDAEKVSVAKETIKGLSKDKIKDMLYEMENQNE